MAFDGDAVPGLAIPGYASPGVPEMRAVFTFIGRVAVTYLNYFGSSGTLVVTPGASYTVPAFTVASSPLSPGVMGASGRPYALSWPPADGKWLINGVLYPFVAPKNPTTLHAVSSGYSIHDEWCNKCFQRHWEQECPPDPRAELTASRVQAQKAAMM